MLVTSIYQSNGVLPNVTSTDQLLQFNNLFNDLLAQLSVKNIVSYLFTDSNINLLNNVTTNFSNYLNTIFSNGFLQLNRKATRMQEASSSLIDHIVSNDKKQIFVTFFHRKVSQNLNCCLTQQTGMILWKILTLMKPMDPSGLNTKKFLMKLSL